MNATLAPHDIHRLLNAEHDDPFGVLGMHKIDELWVVRAFRPDAKELTVIDRHQPRTSFSGEPYSERGVVRSCADRGHGSVRLSVAGHHLVRRDLPN